MPIPQRTYTVGGASNYRYGFNGKENDNEVKGTGNQQDYGMRIYDPRIGRFLSTDPLFQSYPWYTPYQFAGNTPIQAIDVDGLEPAIPAPTIKLQQPVLAVPYEDDPQSWTHKADGWQVNNQFGLAVFTNVGYYGWDWFGGRSFERFVRNRMDPDKNNAADITTDFLDFSLSQLSVGFKGKGGRFGDMSTMEGMARHEVPSQSSMKKANTGTARADNPTGLVPKDPFHYETGSYGWRGKAYRAKETELLKNGKFQEAFDMGMQDLRDVHSANKKFFDEIGFTEEVLENTINQMTKTFKDLLPTLEKKYNESQKK